MKVVIYFWAWPGFWIIVRILVMADQDLPVRGVTTDPAMRMSEGSREPFAAGKKKL